MNCIWNTPSWGRACCATSGPGRASTPAGGTSERSCYAWASRRWRRNRAPSRARPQDLPVSAAQAGDQPRQPGLGAGHHLHPHGARFCLSHRRGGCGQPQGTGTQGGDHVGGRSCQGGDRAGLCPLRDPRDRQHRPAASSRRWNSQMSCSPAAASCRWTGAAPGGTTSLSSACGAASNTNGYI